MFITTRTYTATRAISRQLEYACAHCGARAAATVEATATAQSRAVYGVGGSANAAAQSANSAAEHQAFRALQEAPCPRCGRYQPQLEASFKAYADGVARTKRRRLPLAAFVALLVIGAGIVPAIRDLAISSALLITVLLAAAAAFGIALAVFGAPPRRPVPPHARIHFWWGLPDGSVGWVPPPPVPLPSLPSHPIVHVVGVLAGGALGIASLVALGAYSSTFEDVFVVDGSATPIVVDGVDVTKDVSAHSAHDTSYRRLSVRSDRDHRLELAGVTYALGKDASHGWLVVPSTVGSDRCFSEEESIYGRTSAEPQFAELTAKDGVIALPRGGYGNLFEVPRKTVLLNEHESVRHVWSLRSRPCAEMAEEDD